MADLAHLLEEPEEALQQEEEQEWNQDDRETIDLPQIQKEHEKAEVDRLDLDDLVQKDSQTESAYGKLRNLWIQELNSPELLPYDEETIQYLTEAVQAQEDTSEFTGNANVDALLSSIVKVDSERVKFLVSDLLKLRLWKIQSYPLHMRKNIDKMSENEVRLFHNNSVFPGCTRMNLTLVTGCVFKRIRPSARNAFEYDSIRSFPGRFLETDQRARND